MRRAAVDDRLLPEASEPRETRANSVFRLIVFGENDGLVPNHGALRRVCFGAVAPGSTYALGVLIGVGVR